MLEENVLSCSKNMRALSLTEVEKEAHWQLGMLQYALSWHFFTKASVTFLPLFNFSLDS